MSYFPPCGKWQIPLDNRFHFLVTSMKKRYFIINVVHFFVQKPVLQNLLYVWTTISIIIFAIFSIVYKSKYKRLIVHGAAWSLCKKIHWFCTTSHRIAPSLKRIIKMLHSVVYRDSQSILCNLHRQHLTSKKNHDCYIVSPIFYEYNSKKIFCNICAYTLLCSGLLSLAVI